MSLNSPAPRRHWLQRAVLAVDWPLTLLLFALCGLGLVVLYSASGGSTLLVERQAIRMAIGFMAMMLIAQMSPRLLFRLAWLPYLLAFVLLLMVPFFGFEAKGAKRWIRLAGIGFQPSEIMKLAMPLLIAWYASRKPMPLSLWHACLALVLILLPTLLILNQPDLGTSLLVISSGLFVVFLAGIAWRWLILAGIAGLSMAPVMWFWVMRDYQKQRVLTMFDPETDPLGAGWNIIQSTTAIGSGGLRGKGFMEGTQSQLSFLPESHTDFIIAVLAEEWGFVGVLVLLSLYLLILTRCFMLSAAAESVFGRLLAGAITMTFFIYIFVNAGMVAGILPVVGVPLPMLSYGGTAIVTLMAGFGLMMAVTKTRRLA